MPFPLRLHARRPVCYPISMKNFFLPLLFIPLSLHAQDLQTRVENITQPAPVLQGAWWAGQAGYPNGKTLFSINARQRMAPASTLKLITSAAALETFGPEHRFETRLYADAAPDKNGILRGNLYLRGGGDPALGSPRPAAGEDAHSTLTRWAKEIKKAGIQRVEGHIYADETLFEGLSVPPKVNWENMGNYYAAPVSALSLGDNAFRIRFAAQNVHGGPVAVKDTDPLMPVNITSFVTADAKNRRDNAYVYAAPGQYDLVIYGTIPTTFTGFSIQAALPDPALFTAQAFKQALAENGVHTTGDARKLSAAPDYTALRLLYTQQSVPLKDILYVLNKRSFNFYAEMLLRQLAVNAGEKGSLENGIKQLEKWLRARQIPLEDVKIYDGSGLSRDNMLTARALTATLNAMTQSPYFNVYYHTLATPDDRGDLLVLRRWLRPRRRVEDVRVKGGTIDGVKAVAGYVKDRDGKWVSFALLANNLADKNEAILRLHENIIRDLLDAREPTDENAPAR